MAECCEDERCECEFGEVREVGYPESNISEKAQAAEYTLNAAYYGMQLQLDQLEMQRRDIDRSIDDLKDRLKGVR